MSNDEYKTSMVNNNRFYFGQVIANNNYSNYNASHYQTVFSAKQSDKKNSLASITSTPPSTYTQAPTRQTDNVSDNNSSKNNKSHDQHFIDSKFMPMNFITNTGLDLSHSTRKPTFTSYYHDSLCTLNNNSHNNSNTSSPSSSTSASIDVENDDNNDNDDSGDRIMSPVSIPSTHQQKPLSNDTRNPSQSAFTNMELTAGSMPTGFPLNYQQIYANNAALYGAPVMFSGAIHAAHASYMTGLPLHAAFSPNESYLKAIQAAACGIYSPTALAPPPPPPPPSVSSSSSAAVNSSIISGKPSSLHNPTGSTLMALAPSTQPMGISMSPLQQYSQNIASSNISEVEQHQQKKRDFHTSSYNSEKSLILNNSGSGGINNTNSTGTYLNDKVNERLSGGNTTKDSHFKVPNGKEGSLKHRILRPPNNSDSMTEQNKTPVMRTYSTTSNFKKGNYIELANGSLRRVEDMRTEDFIQCADRSPHHQLAESTVVRINTSLPATAVITFSYDRNRSKVDMEVSLDHPFFVYGQGWASCNPEMSMKMFGLKCQRLQVGDICISLTKREQSRQPTPPISHATQNSTSSQINEALHYQRRHSLTVSSPSAANHTSPSLPTTISATTELPYSTAMNAHAFSIPVPQPNHHLQQQHQQTYAEMAKLMSSYAYSKGLPQLPHEQLKEVVMDAAIMQNLPPKMMSAFYQNQIFQLAQQHQQQQQQEHLRQTELKNNQHKVANVNYNASPSLIRGHSPQPTEFENNYSQQQQPPQTQPLDVTMSRKRRWSAPENMFDDDESETQAPHNRSSPATARS